MAAQAGALHFCDAPAALNATQQDKLFRFGAIIKAELEKSGQNLALVSRSGLDLARFGQRYSHAGVSLKASQNAAWSVRQLYYACDEQKPKIYDQGLAGFLLGADSPSLGYLSVVFLPPNQAATLEHAALDNRQAMQVLGSTYSANSYPFNLRYQNCNQWVMELLAASWGGLGQGDKISTGETPADTTSATIDNPLRAQAQAWLRHQGYQPSVIDVGWPLMWLGSVLPWVHSDDHPPEDLANTVYRVSMPASIEAFVQATVPGATRVEFCHTEHQVVIRRGWDLIPEGCQPGAQDTVIALD